MRVALRLALPFLLAFTSHANPRLASPSSSGPSSKTITANDISPHVLPRSVPQSWPSYTHLASDTASKEPFNIIGLAKHVFPVPGTNVILTISLGKALENVALASFLGATEDHVQTQIARYGPNAVLPMGMFEWDLGEDLEMVAASPLELIHVMTWVDLKNAIKGLQEFLIGRQNYREAACRVSLSHPMGLFIGHVDVIKRPISGKINVGRSVTTIPGVNDNTNL